MKTPKTLIFLHQKLLLEMEPSLLMLVFLLDSRLLQTIFREARISLDDELIQNKDATFFAKVKANL